MLAWCSGSSAAALAVWLCFWESPVELSRSLPEPGSPACQGFPGDVYARNPLLRLLITENRRRKLSFRAHMTVLVGFIEKIFGRGCSERTRQRYAGSEVWGVIHSQEHRARGTAFCLLAHSVFMNLDAFGLLSAKTTSSRQRARSDDVVLVPSLLLCIVYEKTRSLLAVSHPAQVIDGGKLLTWFLWSLVLPGLRLPHVRRRLRIDRR